MSSMEVAAREPSFTLKQIRDAIPARLFVRSTFQSSLYLGRDILFAVLMWVVVAPWIDSVQSMALRFVLWNLFAFMQGVILTGMWVVAHECGHSAFSPSDTINNVVGLVTHSFLLVPFFSWKFTHAAHHGATNNMEKDQVFVPDTDKLASSYASHLEWLEDAPLWQLYYSVKMLLLGWPAYLIANFSAAPNPPNDKRMRSHFLPECPLFTKDQSPYVTLSNYALVVMLGVLSIWINRYGFSHFATRYLFPYLHMNAWLIFYTYLHHTAQNVPHYEDNEWTFIRGALATIDRPYGVFDFFHHSIGSSHVVHHFFSRMPHYNAAEATQYLQKVVGGCYRYDPTNVFVAFWREYCACRFVSRGDDNLLWFKKSFRHTPIPK